MRFSSEFGAWLAARLLSLRDPDNRLSGLPSHGWLALLAVVLLAGCQQKMASQPSLRPLEESEFFADGRASRDLVPGTVARGHLRSDLHLYTGRRSRDTSQAPLGETKLSTATPPPVTSRAAAGTGMFVGQNANFVETFPFPMTKAVLEHGRNRYMIYCVVCHDPQGTGRGKIVERGYTHPPSYHIPRLREARVGYLYAVISDGFGSMPSHAGQIPPRDRWAIVGYLRALQASQHFPRDELTPEMQREFDEQTKEDGG